MCHVDPCGIWHPVLMRPSSHPLTEPAMLTAAIVAAAVDETWAEKGWGMTDLDHVWARGSHLQLVANILLENLWKTNTSPTTLLVGGLEHFLFSPIVGMNDDAIWFSYFQMGWNHQPDIYIVIWLRIWVVKSQANEPMGEKLGIDRWLLYRTS